MSISQPVHKLKSHAKKLKQEKSISMTDALNLVAQKEGYSSWSLLMSKLKLPENDREILNYLNPGDLVIIGARPGVGKTSFSIGQLVQAIQAAQAKHFYFSLAEVHRDVAGRMALYDQNIGYNEKKFLLDYSDNISAEYIINRTSDIEKGSLVFVDYLQLLDEKRTNPELQIQIEQLKDYAVKTGAIFIFISQVDREVEYRIDKKPQLEDIRLPNPLDLKLFNKIILLHKEKANQIKAEVCFLRPKEFSFMANIKT